MLNRVFLLFALLGALLGHADALQFYVSSTGSLPAMPWQSAQQWGGGLYAHQSLAANTGVHLLAGDGGGVYLQSSVDGSWHQLMTFAGLAPATCGGVACIGITGTGTTQAFQPWVGANDICASPASSGRAWIVWNGYIFRSNNVNPANPEATTFINTNQLPNGGFTKSTDSNNTTNRVTGPFLGCDPNNASHVIFGSQGASATTPQVWESLDDGSTFAAYPSGAIPVAPFTSNGNIYINAFDPASGVTGTVTTASGLTGTGLTKTWCVFTSAAGTGHVFCTVDGGVTWFQAGTGGPTTAAHLEFNPTNHTLFVVDNASLASLWSCSITSSSSCTTWTTLITGSSGTSVAWMACDPVTPTHCAALDGGGQLYVSTASGAAGTWSSGFTYNIAAGDSVWYANTLFTFSSSYNIVFDSAHPGIIYGDLGQGHYKTTFPSGSFTWTTNLLGSMHASASSVGISASLKPLYGSQDISLCNIDITMLPQTVCGRLSIFNGLKYTSYVGPSVSDPTYTVAEVAANFSANGDLSGWSRDGFLTDYHPWNRWENEVVANVGICGSIGSGNCATASGNVRVTINPSGTVHDTSGLTTWVNGQGTILCSISRFRINGTNVLYNGNTPIKSCFPVSVVSSSQFDLIGAAYTSALTSITSQINGAPGSYFFFDPTYPGSNLSYARNITSVGTDAGNGLIQVCMFDTRGAPVSPMLIDITGIIDNTGLSPVNGRYIIENPSSSSINGLRCMDLGPTSTLPGGFSYVSGGTGLTYVQAGGALAASGNFLVVAAGSNETPRCSTDLGTSVAGWSDIVNPSPPFLDTVASGGTSGSTRITTAGSGIGTAATILMQMDDGRFTYILPEGNLSIGSGTYTTGSGMVTLTLPIETAAITGDQVTLTALTGTGASALNGTYTPITVTGGGTTVSFMATAGLGAITITGGTFNISGAAVPFARVPSASPANTHYSIPPGRTVANGTGILDISRGWPPNNFLFGKVIAADKVTPNRFYLVNWKTGLLAFTGCGSPVLVNAMARPNGWLQFGGTNAKLDSVPGEAGHLFYTDGPQGSPSHGNGSHKLQRTCNGVTNSAGTGNALPGAVMHGTLGTFAPATFGFGIHAPGKTYPSIAYVGFYDPTGKNLEANAVYGIWRSTDDPNHGNTGAAAACFDYNGQLNGAQIMGTNLTFTSVTAGAAGVGAVAIGDGILGVNGDVATGTRIVSGSGLSWQVNISQTVPTETMTAGGTFQSIGTWLTAIPGQPAWGNQINDFACDPVVFGPCYAQTNEGGFFGVFP